MNFRIFVKELDCEKLCAPKQDEESDGDYAARVEEGKGKTLIRLRFHDDDAGTEKEAVPVIRDSPFFDGSDPQQRSRMLAEALLRMGSVILDVERKKKLPVLEVIDGGAREDFRKLLGK